MSHFHMSVNKYKFFRSLFTHKNINIFLRYENLLEFRKSYVHNSLLIPKNSFIMPLIGVLKQSLPSLIDFGFVNHTKSISVFILSYWNLFKKIIFFLETVLNWAINTLSSKSYLSLTEERIFWEVHSSIIFLYWLLQRFLIFLIQQRGLTY